ncbi:gfo/Idh/MocA family oxidoreductase [Lactonifactor longoviformis]|uniref:Predicted dehydrogenase n=1 Tax=Lactonifactor longoviformis DSM 17459 TaxID=1122155 RepID=A0A1M5BLX8_9CLOT|nr:Gfo/Idh/MocA family oxidoreductase [Lactonifactor longoviformis]POP31994.1 gfo/Idh/MocA family oxidoreductase [Lactonifactor longoviformis]SHF43508.1 Predicted dehydrogenase [Lactonifactor longoviformis DSM 17459]
MIKVGVIGCGKIAQVRHLPEYAENKDAQIAAVFDLCRERAEEVAARYGARAYDSYSELLADPDIDAVSVCAANAAHCEITVAALKAGKHVLCEKPMAITLEECERMVETAKETGKYLMVGHNQRLTKAHAKAKELLVKGEIGSILTFRTAFGHSGPETWAIDSKSIWFFDKKMAAFGAMADLGIHKTDLIQYLTGHRVEEVMAVTATLDKKDASGKKIGVDDNSVCIYKMDNGIVGTMTASWTNYGEEENWTVLYGTEGVMHIYEDPKYSIIIEKKDASRVYYQADQIQTNSSQTKSGIIDAWISCLTEGREPEISGEEALSAMRAVFAALESAETGKAVKTAPH